MNELQEKLKGVSRHLSVWERTTFGQVQDELRNLNKRLEDMQSDPRWLGLSQPELKLVERIQELNHREEIMWRQRSRVMWLTAGDKNTRFFHLRASRRSRNKISRLRKSDGQFTEVDLELHTIVTNFYSNLFASGGTNNMEVVLSTVPVKVTADMNRILLDPYKEGEVKDALFQMFPTKAPVPMIFRRTFFSDIGSFVGRKSQPWC